MLFDVVGGLGGVPNITADDGGPGRVVLGGITLIPWVDTASRLGGRPILETEGPQAINPFIAQADVRTALIPGLHGGAAAFGLLSTDVEHLLRPALTDVNVTGRLHLR